MKICLNDNSVNIEQLFSEEGNILIDMINQALKSKNIKYDTIKDIEDGEHFRSFLGLTINDYYYRNKITLLGS